MLIDAQGQTEPLDIYWFFLTYSGVNNYVSFLLDANHVSILRGTHGRAWQWGTSFSRVFLDSSKEMGFFNP